MNIFVHHNGQQLGPFNESDLRAQIAAGAVAPTDLVWWDGQPSWIPLSQSPYASATPPIPAPVAPGAPPPPPPVPAAVIPAGATPPRPLSRGQTPNLAITSLVCGILGFCLCGIFTSIPAIITGHMARRQIKNNPTLSGAGMALAGIILGYVASALFLIVVTISILIALGNQVQNVFTTISSQLQTAQDNSTSPSDNSTNSPDTNSPTATPTTNQ
jgi:hypothetical protein